MASISAQKMTQILSQALQYVPVLPLQKYNGLMRHPQANYHLGTLIRQLLNAVKIPAVRKSDDILTCEVDFQVHPHS